MINNNRSAHLNNLNHRSCLTEVSVLADILQICKGSHFMVLDPVVTDGPLPKPYVQLASKKKVSLHLQLLQPYENPPHLLRALLVLPRFLQKELKD